jgi:hypothetical protein
MMKESIGLEPLFPDRDSTEPLGRQFVRRLRCNFYANTRSGVGERSTADPVSGTDVHKIRNGQMLLYNATTRCAVAQRGTA